MHFIIEERSEIGVPHLLHINTMKVALLSLFAAASVSSGRCDVYVSYAYVDAGSICSK